MIIVNLLSLVYHVINTTLSSSMRNVKKGNKSLGKKIILDVLFSDVWKNINYPMFVFNEKSLLFAHVDFCLKFADSMMAMFGKTWFFIITLFL